MDFADKISAHRAKIEKIVVMVRLNLYNHGQQCGAKAILCEMNNMGVCPLPSLSAIKKILYRQGLTHKRTGHYQ